MQGNHPSSASISKNVAAGAGTVSAPPLVNAAQKPPTLASDLALAWPPAAQWSALLLMMIAAVLIGLHLLQSAVWQTQQLALERGEPLTSSLDLNKATVAELCQLPGVGPKLAQRIVEERQQRGNFRTIDDLAAVKRIGPITLERLQDWVHVKNPQKAGKLPWKSKTPTPPFTAKKLPGAIKRINVNTATPLELQALHRVGPVISLRIVEERKIRPFDSVEDMQRVQGIGPKTAEQLRPYVSFK